MIAVCTVRRRGEEIAHGYESVELKTKDGVTIQGVLIKEGVSPTDAQHGRDYPIIPASRIAARGGHARIVMMSAAQLGLTPQDVASSCGVPAGELIAARHAGWQDRAHCGRGGDHTGPDADRELPLNSAAWRRFQLRDGQFAMSLASVGCTPNRSVP